MKKIFVCILSGVLTVACGYDRFGTLGPGDLEGSPVRFPMPTSPCFVNIFTATPLWCRRI